MSVSELVCVCAFRTPVTPDTLDEGDADRTLVSHTRCDDDEDEDPTPVKLMVRALTLLGLMVSNESVETTLYMVMVFLAVFSIETLFTVKHGNIPCSSSLPLSETGPHVLCTVILVKQVLNKHFFYYY